MVYPWQAEQWQRLWQAKKNHCLPHAILLSGTAGTGKAYFAEYFVRAHFCVATLSVPACPMQKEETDGCCSCRLIRSRAHPNLLWIQPEKSDSVIKIDQIREASEFVSHTSLQGEDRFVIIDSAHQMNLHAANALLKTLEGPSPGSLMVLISDQQGLLPATILSRCQRLVFPRPPLDTALAWLGPQLSPSPAKTNVCPELLLQLAGGAPLAALQYAKNGRLAIRQTLFHTLYTLHHPAAVPSALQSEAQTIAASPIQSAASFSDLGPVLLLDFVLGWALDLCKIQVGSDEGAIINQDFLSQLVELSRHLHLKAVLNYLVYLQQLRKQLIAGVHLNQQLMFENLLVRWMECAA